MSEMTEMERRSNTVEALAFMFDVRRTVSNIREKGLAIRWIIFPLLPFRMIITR